MSTLVTLLRIKVLRSLRVIRPTPTSPPARRLYPPLTAHPVTVLELWCLMLEWSSGSQEASLLPLFKETYLRREQIKSADYYVKLWNTCNRSYGTTPVF